MLRPLPPRSPVHATRDCAGESTGNGLVRERQRQARACAPSRRSGLPSPSSLEELLPVSARHAGGTSRSGNRARASPQTSGDVECTHGILAHELPGEHRLAPQMPRSALPRSSCPPPQAGSPSASPGGRAPERLAGAPGGANTSSAGASSLETLAHPQSSATTTLRSASPGHDRRASQPTACGGRRPAPASSASVLVTSTVLRAGDQPHFRHSLAAELCSPPRRVAQRREGAGWRLPANDIAPAPPRCHVGLHVRRPSVLRKSPSRVMASTSAAGDATSAAFFGQ